jgi:hypothetical protein
MAATSVNLAFFWGDLVATVPVLGGSLADRPSAPASPGQIYLVCDTTIAPGLPGRQVCTRGTDDGLGWEVSGPKVYCGNGFPDDSSMGIPGDFYVDLKPSVIATALEWQKLAVACNPAPNIMIYGPKSAVRLGTWFPQISRQGSLPWDARLFSAPLVAGSVVTFKGLNS